MKPAYYNEVDPYCPDCASKVVRCPGVGDGPLPHYHEGSLREMNERKKRKMAGAS